MLSAASSGDEIVWYKNMGGGTFTEHDAPSTRSPVVLTVFLAADMDGDGDIDVVSAAPVLIGSNGTRTRATKDSRLTWSAVVSTVRHSLFPADIDGDGDLDILSASHE